ncbi:hypothetical protein F4777DRAFT_272763 [Nemania sp. FL0916]|nr:hypothetical protein F4777DRAFT_272763 [Nemania sp. FL0916]
MCSEIPVCVDPSHLVSTQSNNSPGRPPPPDDGPAFPLDLVSDEHTSPISQLSTPHENESRTPSPLARDLSAPTSPSHGASPSTSPTHSSSTAISNTLHTCQPHSPPSLIARSEINSAPTLSQYLPLPRRHQSRGTEPAQTRRSYSCRFISNQCRKAFGNSASRDDHEDTAHHFVCELGCQRLGFLSRRDRRRHYATPLHGQSYGAFQCGGCGKCENRPDNHRRHLRTCKGRKSGEYVCGRCGDSTRNKEEHIAHWKEVCGRRGVKAPKD